MGFSPRALPAEDETRLRRLTYLRLMMATLIIGAAIMVFQAHGRALSIIALYSLLGVVYLSTGTTYIAHRTGATFKNIIVTLMCIDMAILAMIVHYSGGSTSNFTILYIFPILIGGIYFEVAGGLTAAIAATSIYVIYSVLEMGGYVISPASEWVLPAQPDRMLLRGYLHMAVFVSTGLLSGYISSHVMKKGRELAERERELKNVQLSTDSIIRNMSSGLIVVNMSSEILSVNPAAVSILGLEDPVKLKGKLIDIAMPHMPALSTELTSALENGVPRKRHELEVRRDNGDLLPLGISISILKDEGGEKRGVIALFQDLTEVHKMREKIRRSDKLAAIGRLSASIAHELRAPLASICGSIEMLTSELDLDGDNGELVDLIIKESERLDGIISDFLEFARLRKPALIPMNIEKSIREVVLLLKHSSSVNGEISIDASGGAETARVLADEEQIKQVFLNICLNACEAMDNNGCLTIRMSRAVTELKDSEDCEECIRVDFKNRGPAIPPDVLPHVFEPFYTTKEGGTGLGLAIAARIVESHLGYIKVESVEGAETVFSVILPLSAGADKEKFNVPDLEMSGI